MPDQILEFIAKNQAMFWHTSKPRSWLAAAAATHSWVLGNSSARSEMARAPRSTALITSPSE